MEWHGLDQMLDYHSLCEAVMGFDATGKCACEPWMYKRVDVDAYECYVCKNRIDGDEHDERFIRF